MYFGQIVNPITGFSVCGKSRAKRREGKMSNGTQEIKLHFPEQLQGGVYSNNMAVVHTREEFIMDYLMVAPPRGTVAARIIVSPGHMKRILNALQENIAKYEEKFGNIEVAEGPQGKVHLQ
jgi:hypothetical protein